MSGFQSIKRSRSPYRSPSKSPSKKRYRSDPENNPNSGRQNYSPSRGPITVFFPPPDPPRVPLLPEGPGESGYSRTKKDDIYIGAHAVDQDNLPVYTDRILKEILEKIPVQAIINKTKENAGEDAKLHEILKRLDLENTPNTNHWTDEKEKQLLDAAELRIYIAYSKAERAILNTYVEEIINRLHAASAFYKRQDNTDFNFEHQTETYISKEDLITKLTEYYRYDIMHQIDHDTTVFGMSPRRYIRQEIYKQDGGSIFTHKKTTRRKPKYRKSKHRKSKRRK